MSAIFCSRPAETRFDPFSYFCTCWNVSPIPSARPGLGQAALQPQRANLASDLDILRRPPGACGLSLRAN